MRKLLKLIILTVAITGSHTGILSIVNKINAAQNSVNLQTKYIANVRDNRKIKSDNKNNINSQLSASEKLSNFRRVQFDDTTLKSLDIDEKKSSKLSILSRQSILKEAPIGPSQPPTRPVIDVQLNKSVGDKRIKKPSANNIPEDPQFKPVMEYAIKQNLSQRPMAEIMQAIADYFIGAPYKAGLLDQSNQESLVISLDGFDCVLFVETVLAMARGIAMEDYAYFTFINNIRNQRYWKGKMDGYCSRLHYFSEWIADNQRRGTVIDIGVKLGGERVNKQLFFMSKNRFKYPQIARNDANYQCIVSMEDSISKLKINYIPYYKISTVYSQLKAGDIVAVATEINGLDVTHTGLVYRNSDGNIGLIHASPAGKVTVAYDLERYIWNVESAIGILVARPVDPREVVGVNGR
ncbi:MAG: DUF1460 domain-containing protein [Okeania sp. SIO2G4]|uniref:N-acetylmuramoyl-L-alanine amidase-like domain-containing protein n=1 Tax=unclassified Okeania TaxID=2634635 RepID=UPI0013BC90F0|nr:MULTISPECIES: N-acetylmuramoyl-L-alanine amidase-like domain-containing protein [unclassified Okeania]NEP05684.1 DUF1460 domain-containing protein [Okeania sp. SIO4D6]NEP75577.1 DUF1460 domain-containing protein [Okeania sp. SIO2G5]NEP96704.1 DUF1460 domain-containing protein [Okeania sp. SIO2F5]NEQ94414.1 DUF1460 domain-containing protein [Okeania sp. SIO2G4]